MLTKAACDHGASCYKPKKAAKREQHRKNQKIQFWALLAPRPGWWSPAAAVPQRLLLVASRRATGIWQSIRIPPISVKKNEAIPKSHSSTPVTAPVLSLLLYILQNPLTGPQTASTRSLIAFTPLPMVIRVGPQSYMESTLLTRGGPGVPLSRPVSH